jgi:hypothetical protein
MLFREAIAVSCDNYTKHTNTLCGQNAEFWYVKAGGMLLLWLYSPFLGLGRFFSFLNLYTVGRVPWTGDEPGDEPVAWPLPTQNITNRINPHNTDIHALSEIRTHNSSVRASERRGSCLRPRGHSDRRALYIHSTIRLHGVVLN